MTHCRQQMFPPVFVSHLAYAESFPRYCFDATQMKRLESNGTAVEPYSLYEAQLRKRLGYVPSWLSSLK